MSNIQNIFITLSLLFWAGIVVFEAIHRQNNKKHARFVIQIFLIVVSVFVLHNYFGYFNTIQEKGGMIIQEHWTLCGLYVSTIIGIVGHHVFIQIRGVEESKRKTKIKWMPLIKPLIVSPIIFLAVMNQLAQMGAGGEGLKANIMQFILAFQNGFFGKQYLNSWNEKKIKRSMI
jgi:hypothetical protein